VVTFVQRKALVGANCCNLCGQMQLSIKSLDCFRK